MDEHEVMSMKAELYCFILIHDGGIEDSCSTLRHGAQPTNTHKEQSGWNLVKCRDREMKLLGLKHFH